MYLNIFQTTTYMTSLMTQKCLFQCWGSNTGLCTDYDIKGKFVYRRQTILLTLHYHIIRTSSSLMWFEAKNGLKFIVPLSLKWSARRHYCMSCKKKITNFSKNELTLQIDHIETLLLPNLILDLFEYMLTLLC